jgi:hypothetical protein
MLIEPSPRVSFAAPICSGSPQCTGCKRKHECDRETQTPRWARLSRIRRSWICRSTGAIPLRSACSPGTRRRCSAWGRTFHLSRVAAASPPTKSRSMESITLPYRTQARSDGMESRWCPWWMPWRNSKSRPAPSRRNSATPRAGGGQSLQWSGGKTARRLADERDSYPPGRLSDEHPGQRDSSYFQYLHVPDAPSFVWTRRSWIQANMHGSRYSETMSTGGKE